MLSQFVRIYRETLTCKCQQPEDEEDREKKNTFRYKCRHSAAKKKNNLNTAILLSECQRNEHIM